MTTTIVWSEVMTKAEAVAEIVDTTHYMGDNNVEPIVEAIYQEGMKRGLERAEEAFERLVLDFLRAQK
jgi:hypothetical protein